MTIWILALLLFAGVGALGRQIGGIRMGISLVGVLVALFAAGPLAPIVRSALGSVGVKNPILMWSLAAPLAFLGIMMVFNSVAAAVYIKISGYFKFRAPDDVRMRWERIDSGLGLTAGLMAAVLYLLAASSYVFHVGYFTTQIESPTDNPIWLKLTNKMSSDLTSTGFDRVAVGVGQASPGFFQMADVAGLLYHNPDLQSRLPEYPLFMSLAEQADLQGMFTNATYAPLLPAKTNISLILKEREHEPLPENDADVLGGKLFGLTVEGDHLHRDEDVMIEILDFRSLPRVGDILNNQRVKLKVLTDDPQHLRVMNTVDRVPRDPTFA